MNAALLRRSSVLAITALAMALGSATASADDTLGHIARAQDLKELIQLALERAFDQVEQEHDHDGKRQGTVAGKVCFGASVPGNEVRIVDEIT